MYPYEPLFNSINGQEHRTAHRASVSNAIPSHRHLLILLYQGAGRSHGHNPEHLRTATALLISLSPEQTRARGGYAPRELIGFGFICQCSSLTPFPPSDTQTRAKQNCSCSWWEKTFVSGDYGTDKQTSLMVLVPEKDPPWKFPSHSVLWGSWCNTCQEIAARVVEKQAKSCWIR